MADPIHQFQIVKVVDLPDVTLPLVGVVDLAITNSHIAMTIAFAAVVLFLTLVTSKATVVPGRLQAVGEGLFGLIDNLTDSIIGHDGRKYFPFVFTVFVMILGMNLLGMALTFTATSQLAITATFAVITFGLVLIIGFAKNGLGFFKLFWPMGAPLVMRPVVGLIELFSFMLRPVTLALRLFGNMLGGHVALKVFAGFVVTLGAMAAGGGLGLLGIPGAALSMTMVVGLTALSFRPSFSPF
jgi:F-type H+-transporting ATPase subunit a